MTSSRVVGDLPFGGLIRVTWNHLAALGFSEFMFVHILLPLSPFVAPSLPNPPMAPLDLLGRHPKWSSKVMVETQVCWSQNGEHQKEIWH